MAEEKQLSKETIEKLKADQDRIFIIIKGHLLDVTDFTAIHPGICG